MDNYYIQDDFPAILVMIYILVFIALLKVVDGILTSLAIATAIYIFTYIMYKIIQAIWQK